jgi:hypothetical protein
MSHHPNLHDSQRPKYGATNGVPTKDAATLNNVGGTAYGAANRNTPLKIAIIGAGAAGLAAARIVSRSCNNDDNNGHRPTTTTTMTYVTVLEKDP